VSQETDTPTDEAPVFRPTLPAAVARAPEPRPPTFDDPFVRALNTASLHVNDAPTTQRKKRRFRVTFGGYLLFRIVLSVVVSVALAVGGFVWDRYFKDDEAAPYPETWDVRVAQYAHFVESERGLTFEHPVYVDFMSEADFVDLFEPDDFELSDEARDDADDAADAVTQLSNAAGLSTSSDPVADNATVSQVTTLGFFSLDADRIVLRGDDLTPDVQAVLVHELTHALQHQHFDVQVGGPDDFEVRSIVEADAMRIEDAYTATLGDADRGVAIAGTTDDGSMDAALSDVPWALIDRSQAPYILGPIFLEHVIDQGGNAAADAVFADIPTSRELIDPSTYDTEPDTPHPALDIPTGADIIEPVQEWSKYDALVMLDAWLPWRDSRMALDGWVVGSYASYTEPLSDRVCFRTSVRFDTPEQSTAYGAAITAWATAAGSATGPIFDLNGVLFSACPRAAGALDSPRPTLMPSEELYVEHALLVEIDPIGTPTAGDPWYSCVARALVDDPTFTSLAFTDTLTVEQDAAITVASDTARWICGAAPVG
jgi:hypothetical protein